MKRTSIILLIIFLLILGLWRCLRNARMQQCVTKYIKEKRECGYENNLNEKESLLEKEQTITKSYYEKAKRKAESLTLDEKIDQMLLVEYSTNNKTNAYGGILFFEDDFENKSKEKIKAMVNSLQNISGIPFLTAVDEEGISNGRGVVRVSSNRKLTKSNAYLKGTPFPSPQTLYANGGFDLIEKDTIQKSKFLYQLGINLNLAPVADICQKGDYMYSRSVGLDAKGTSQYVKTIINASKIAQKQGYKVSYCLKHFPGYGSNSDTHIGFSVDERTYEEVKKDMASFEAGIIEGAEVVMISHNIVSSIDGENPASLSPKIHSILRNELNFNGVIMTDALNMGALDNIEGSKYVKAVLAGNDMLIVTDGNGAHNDIKEGVRNGIIKEAMTDEAVIHILSWKYEKLANREM